jgi:hypothetical protein
VVAEQCALFDVMAVANSSAVDRTETAVANALGLVLRAVANVVDVARERCRETTAVTVAEKERR